MEYNLMRTLFTALLSLVVFGMVGSATPAHAKWSCDGPEYVCGGAPAATAKAKPASSLYNAVPKAPKAPKAVATSYAAPKAKAAKKSYDGGDNYSGSGSVYQSGIASYYWQPQKVASGGWFNPNAMTAAHKTLPFGTKVRVTNKNNGKSVVVTINDRGPYIAGRVIDLSKAAAGVVGMQGSGIAPVTVAVLGKG